MTRAFILIQNDRIMFQPQPDARLLDLTAQELGYAIDNQFVSKHNEHVYIFTAKGRTFLSQLKIRQQAEVAAMRLTMR